MNIKEWLEILMISRQHFRDWLFVGFIVIFSNTYLKKINGHVRAFAAYSFGKLHYIAVDRVHRSKGLGTQVFKRIISRISVLKTNPENKAAINFFKKFGFRVHRETWGFYGKRLVMKKAAIHESL